MKISYLPNDDVNTMTLESDIEITFGHYMLPLLERNKRQIMEEVLRKLITAAAELTYSRVPLELDGQEIDLNIQPLVFMPNGKDIWYHVEVHSAGCSVAAKNVVRLQDHQSKRAAMARS